jgi:WD40 repeat protein
MHVRADRAVLVTGSADKDVKFWDIDVQSTQSSVKVTLAHSRTLKMTDEVLAVRYSPNGKFLAVALLDATVKVFFQDSLKFFISLYGHKVWVNYNRHVFMTHLAIASSAFDGHIRRLQAHRDLLSRQKCQDMGS